MSDWDAGTGPLAKRRRPQQRWLFDESGGLGSKVISKRGDFEALFEGYRTLRAISYVASVKLLAELRAKWGFERLEVVVGDTLSANQSEDFRRELREGATGVLEVLEQATRSGSLRVLIPRQTLHTKLYILEDGQRRRVIQTSANLTDSARLARQVNYAWFADLDAGHPWMAEVERDYAAHTADCEEFMGDLRELLDRERSVPRDEVIRTWLECVGAETESAVAAVVREVGVEALAPSNDGVIQVQLPSSPKARRELQKLFKPLGATMSRDQATIAAGDYLKHIERSHGLPLLHVDVPKRELRIGLAGETIKLNRESVEQEEIDQGLEHLEAYVESISWGQASDPLFAKTSVAEALLYVFFSPFAHEFMKNRRARLGSMDRRGPRLLYIYGNSHNGKSTFLRFALKFLTDRQVEPLAGSSFKKRQIENALLLGTSFPMAFDDVMITRTAPVVEEVVKSYWEQWWRPEHPVPSLVLTSNTPTLKDWARSRVKRLHFDVHFSPDAAIKERLAQLYRTDCSIFGFFARAYLDLLGGDVPATDDELALARRAMGRLYEIAERKRPSWLPDRPIEEIYDPDQRLWAELIYRSGKAKLRRLRDRIEVDFAEEFQSFEVGRWEAMLPPTLSRRRQGRKVIVEPPGNFEDWLREDRPSWPARVRSRLRF